MANKADYTHSVELVGATDAMLSHSPQPMNMMLGKSFNELTIKDRRNNFLRRTKATAPPDTTDTESTTIDTTTSKYTRRGQSKFKSRTKVAAEKIGAENELEKRRPSLNVGVRSERPTRTFVRRRLGGANATTASTAPSTASVPASTASDSPSTSASSVSSASTRRPFRVASRRRLVTTTTTSTTTTASPTTTHLASDESLQEIDIDSIEDPNLTARVVPKKTVKVQRRPLVTLKEEEVVDKKRPRLIPFGDEVADQNPSATNEEERKRQSKKYSASFKQNQLDEKLRQKAKSQEEVDTTTEGKITTVEVYDSETALALAAHQLLAAPLPSVSDYDETTTSPRKSSTTQAYKYTDTTNTDSFTDTRTPIYSEDFTSTSYRTSTNPDYVQTSTGNSFNLLSSPKTSTINIPTAFTTSGYTKPRLTTPELSPTIISSGLSGVSSNLNPSTARYIGSTEKYLSVPVEDFAYSTGGYGSTAQEPAYFTREYLLESPVTRTYDDEYQYLSPVTTPVTTTRKVPKKTVYRRISTTIRPTTPAYVPPSSPSTIKPRRVPTKKPFEKTPVKKEPAKTYQPIENYDYYDDLNEKLVEKYAEGTKVVLHGKGTIECLDIGNFPHPSSCKKFISCARMESGAILGWEYVCPKGLSFDPVGGICNWSAGLGCDE